MLPLFLYSFCHMYVLESLAGSMCQFWYVHSLHKYSTSKLLNSCMYTLFQQFPAIWIGGFLTINRIRIFLEDTVYVCVPRHLKLNRTWSNNLTSIGGPVIRESANHARVLRFKPREMWPLISINYKFQNSSKLSLTPGTNFGPRAC